MTGRALLIGVDIGTTGVKGIVLEPERGILAEAWREQELLSPHPGWAEMDPAGWWDGVTGVIRDLLTAPGVARDEVRAVGVAGMVPALVLLDEHDRPLRHSIQQNDARAVSELAWWRANVDPDEFFRATGGSINQQVLGPKLRWVANHDPHAFAMARHILGSYDYVTLCLTGSRGVEANWALESGLANIAEGAWNWDYVRSAGIQPEMLPAIRQPAEIAGYVTPDAAAATGLRPGIPVVGGAADHVASAFAAGLIDHGDLNLKFGGAGDILYCLDRLVTDPRLFIDYHLMPGKYLINGCMATSGSVVKWFANDLCAQGRDAAAALTYAELDALAAPLEPSPDSLVLLPYFLGEKTPLHDPTARGVILGLTLHHRAEHIHRAILEGVVFAFRHHVEVLAGLGLQPSRVVATDGGARSRLWRQIAADVLQVPIIHQADHPGSALGAAFVAGMGAGVFADWAEIRRYSGPTSTTEPRPAAQAPYDHLYRLFRDAYPALRPSFAALAATPVMSKPTD